MTIILKITYKDVGRSKFTGTIEHTVNQDNYKFDAYEVASLAVEDVKHHLMSSNIECIYDPTLNRGRVIVGGFRTVGTFSVENSKEVVV